MEIRKNLKKLENSYNQKKKYEKLTCKPLLGKIKPKRGENVAKKWILSPQIVQNKQLKQYL